MRPKEEVCGERRHRTGVRHRGTWPWGQLVGHFWKVTPTDGQHFDTESGITAVSGQIWGAAGEGLDLFREHTEWQA